MENLTLIQKLAKIRSIADAVSKSKKGFNYNYADIVEVLAKVTAGMNKYGVSLIPMVVPGTAKVEPKSVVNTKFTKTGEPYSQTVTEMVVYGDMVFKWVDNDNQEDFIEVPWFVTGSQSDPSQAFGSGLTYCTRYFLTNYFQIAQPDTDVDAYRGKQRAAEEAEDLAVAKGIVEQIDLEMKKFCADHEDKKDDIKKFVSKYVKNGNYMVIREPELAAKLLEDFKNTFLAKE